MDEAARWWGDALKTIRAVSYQDVARTSRLPLGTCIFSDLERLSPEETTLAVHVWNRLANAKPAKKPLNHPQRALRRYDLLTTLWSQGRNDFRPFRATESLAGARFPVFVRQENEHTGGLTPPLNSEMEVRAALRGLLESGQRLRDLLVVELCDTSNATGVFRKYSAFRIGDRIVPRRLLFGSSWMVKMNSEDLIDASTAAEEREYVETNPHESAVREIFEIAQIEYGRVDYGILNGRVQVWEINTNPTLLLEPERYHPLHVSMQHEFATRFSAALGALDSSDGDSSSVSLAVPSVVLRGVSRVLHRRRLGRSWRRWKRAVAASVPRLANLLRSLRAAAVPARLRIASAWNARAGRQR